MINRVNRISLKHSAKLGPETGAVSPDSKMDTRNWKLEIRPNLRPLPYSGVRREQQRVQVP